MVANSLWEEANSKRTEMVQSSVKHREVLADDNGLRPLGIDGAGACLDGEMTRDEEQQEPSGKPFADWTLVAHESWARHFICKSSSADGGLKRHHGSPLALIGAPLLGHGAARPGSLAILL